MAEDACQTAWVALLRREDVPLDARGLAWMRIVARTAGYRAARGRDTPAGSFQATAGHTETGELPEPAGEEPDRWSGRSSASATSNDGPSC